MCRRMRAGRMMLAMVAGVSLILSGCSTNWVDDAEQIVAALIPATANLVTLVTTLQGRSIAAEDLEKVQSAGKEAEADLELIQSLIAAYRKAGESARVGILNQIESGLNAAKTDLAGLVAALHIKDAATQAKITAVVGIVLAEVQSLEAVVQALRISREGPAVARRSVGSGQAVTASNSSKAVPLAARDFIHSYNSTLTAKTGNAELDRAAGGLQLHRHGVVARWASGGVLQ